jgi:four helix bundle protein
VEAGKRSVVRGAEHAGKEKGKRGEMKTKSYKDLIAYQKAYDLTLEIYRVTKSFPTHELYAMVSQMRRAAVSMPCNISEGYRRGHQKEYIQFLNIARGSCGELETLISLSNDLGYLSERDFSVLHAAQDEVSRLLIGLISAMYKRRGGN